MLDRLWPTHFSSTSLEGRVSQEILACNYHWTGSGGNWREHHCVDSKNMSNNTLLFWIRYCRVWCLGIASTMISMSWISRVGFLVCLVVRLVSHSRAHLFLNFLTYVLRPQMACHGVLILDAAWPCSARVNILGQLRSVMAIATCWLDNSVVLSWMGMVVSTWTISISNLLLDD